MSYDPRFDDIAGVPPPSVFAFGYAAPAQTKTSGLNPGTDKIAVPFSLRALAGGHGIIILRFLNLCPSRSASNERALPFRRSFAVQPCMQGAAVFPKDTTLAVNSCFLISSFL